jgi:hypothetical protein
MEETSLLLPFDPVPKFDDADSISFDFGMMPLPEIESLEDDVSEPVPSKKRGKEDGEFTPDKLPGKPKVSSCCGLAFCLVYGFCLLEKEESGVSRSTAGGAADPLRCWGAEGQRLCLFQRGGGGDVPS